MQGVLGGTNGLLKHYWNNFTIKLPEQKKVVGLERGPLSLVSTTEELLDRKVAARLENREYGRRDPSRWPRGTLYPQKLATTSPTSGDRSVGIVRSRTWTTEFSFLVLLHHKKRFNVVDRI
jgi:hypothetical protein